MPTSLSPDELREKLRKWEPWMIRIDFTNGVSTSECKQLTPFAEYPLGKFGVVEGVSLWRSLREENCSMSVAIPDITRFMPRPGLA